MTEADGLIAWFETLKNVGFATLMGLILFGNFAGIWLWGRTHRERILWYEAQLAKEEAEKTEWKNMALGLLAPLETMKNRLPQQRPRG